MTLLYVTVNGRFPGDSSTLSWAPLNGSVATYVADLQAIILTGSGTLPAATATIP